MLYLIHGTNIDKIKAKQNELVSIMQKKQPDVSLYKINENGVSLDLLNELLSSQGLFLAKYIVVLDRLITLGAGASKSANNINSEISDFLIKNLENFKESDHAWIIVEEKISAPNLKKLEKFAFKVFHFDESSAGENRTNQALSLKKERPTSFAFAENFAVRNKALAWQEFQKLKEAELAGEEIHGVLWWQFKSVFLAKSCKDAGGAKNAGLSPYVFQKSKKASLLWSDDELNSILKQLVLIYHDAHRGEGDLMVGLERLTLKL